MTSQYVLLKTNSYIIRMNREDNLCWYHGRVSRERAEEILRKEGISGVFLVRESSTAYGDYVLSVLHEGVVWHYQIRRHGEDAFFSIDDQTTIHGLDSLIEYYREASHGLVTQLVAIIPQDLPPNDARRHGKTNLLHRATKEENFTVVSELLKCGYRNIDAKNMDGQTAVHLACKLGNSKILNIIIENGANINCRDTEGNTPLHYACRSKNLRNVQLLINANANVQARNNETGWVPLHDAANEGCLEIVKELINVNVPHMPRTNYGEFPIDFARLNGHTQVVEYLTNYKPPQPTTFKYQWYHETLDRGEAVKILREYVQNTLVPKNTDEDLETLSSGVFLVRYSNRNGGSYVLTLLFEDQPKNFMIQSKSNYLFIDEGPYMTSLEHLIQHYTIFSDGLPINLKYPVPPKPKPPIPLFSTIPKKKNRLNQSLSASGVDNLGLSISTDSSVLDAVMNNEDGLKQINTSTLNDSSINQQGVWEKETIPTPSKETTIKKKTKINALMDGMKSLKKNKGKLSSMNENNNSHKTMRTNSVDAIELAQKAMQNLSFSTDFLEKISQDEFYNTPSNNCSVDTSSLTTTTSVDTSHSSDNNDNPSSPNTNYFTESDKMISIYPDMADKEQEDIYFVDAPTISVDSSLLNISNNNNNVNNNENSCSKNINNNNENLSVNSNGYVLSKNVPMFFDNQLFADRMQCDRLQSIISEASQISDSDSIMLYNQNINSISNDPKPNYFIPKESLISEDVLGQGEFGNVYRGTLEIKTENENLEQIPVAIKTLHDERCKENRVQFYREAHVMMQLRHHCIVRMIGISKGPPLRMVQELVPLGSMLTYLQTNFNKISSSNYELKLWASQIACGMNYLETQHFVHRDLAARNILLASLHQAKISDFGLSRALNAGDDYYQASQGGKWPIKWYAPESFNYGTFSHASDVWSYGVTLWEMFSIGQPPYGDMKGVDVIKLIESGDRLKQPALCPDKIFSVMESCWNYKPKNRPTFKQLTDFFSNDPEYQNISELIQTNSIS